MSQSPQWRGTVSRVGELITEPGNNLGSLFSHARVLAKLDSLLTGFSDPELATRFQVANIRQDRLTLLTPSAAWATRLRLQTTSMLGFLKASGYAQIRYIDIRISPLQRREPEPKNRRESSPAAKEAADIISSLTDKHED